MRGESWRDGGDWSGHCGAGASEQAKAEPVASVSAQLPETWTGHVDQLQT